MSVVFVVAEKHQSSILIYEIHKNDLWDSHQEICNLLIIKYQIILNLTFPAIFACVLAQNHDNLIFWICGIHKMIYEVHKMSASDYSKILDHHTQNPVEK